MAIGAYVCALITSSVSTPMGMAIGMIAGAAVSALVALIVGIPTLRLDGDYLAIATMGVAEIIRIILNNMKITNGQLDYITFLFWLLGQLCISWYV